MTTQEIKKIVNETPPRDLIYRNYQQRQQHEVEPEQISLAAGKTSPAEKFSYNGQLWVPNEYKGYAVVSMLNANPGNEELTLFLASLQQEMRYNLQPLNGFYMLPPESFHQTVANTLSADRYKSNILNAGLEAAYPGMVRSAFSKLPKPQRHAPLRMRLIGLSVFGTAIGMLGTFEYETDYSRITSFRSGFYDDAQLENLDIRMTRPFIGHITLAYIEQKLNKNQKEHLATTINELNEGIRQHKHYFLISNTGLRKYDHLAEFQNQEHFPVYHFVQ